MEQPLTRGRHRSLVLALLVAWIELLPALAAALEPPRPPVWSSLSVGNGTGCAVLRAGGVACWGSNLYGQLGIASGPDVATHLPDFAAGVANATAVSTKAFVSCARIAGGTVQCWGNNSHGSLGNGATAPSPLPQRVQGPAAGQIFSNATAVSVGEAHACALDRAGAVYCWGANRWGQLGDGTTTDRSLATPVLAPAGVRFVDLSVGLEHSCALSTQGAVYCWGANNYGQLNGATSGPAPSFSAPASTSPVLISLASKARGIAAGDRHSCAILSAGSVACWGDDSRGQSHAPMRVVSPPAALSRVVALSAGGRHTCALTVHRRVYCWGSNVDSQLGSGVANVAGRPGGALVALAAVDMGFAGVVAVAAGTTTTCIRLHDDRIQCWGESKSGEAGNGLNRGSGLNRVTLKPSWIIDPATPSNVPLPTPAM